jgi:hypothetical protein
MSCSRLLCLSIIDLTRSNGHPPSGTGSLELFQRRKKSKARQGIMWWTRSRRPSSVEQRIWQASKLPVNSHEPLHDFSQRFNSGIGLNTGTGVGHDQPIAGVNQDAFDKGPLAAHKRLNRMNGAKLIPKYAISVLALSQHKPVAGKAAISIDQLIGLGVDIAADGRNIAAG